MNLSPVFWMALVAAGTGVAILWINSARPLNRALALLCGFVGVWIGLYDLAAVAGTTSWLRAPWAAGAFVFFFLRLAQDAIGSVDFSFRGRTGNARSWLAWGAALAVLSLLDFFVVPSSDGTGVKPQFGYYLYQVLACASAIAFAVGGVWQMRGQTREKRLELQVLTLGGTCLTLWTFGASLLTAGGWFPSLVQLVPVVAVGMLVGTVWALVSTRVLDARHILLLLIEKALLVTTVTAFIWGLDQLAERFVPSGVAFVLAVTLGLWFAAEFSPWLQETFKGKAEWERTRRAAREIARKELKPEAMEDAFLKLLCTWAGCERAVIMMSTQGRLVGGGLEFKIDLPAMKALHVLRWSSLERLSRMRSNTELADLQRLMVEQDFGVMTAGAGASLGLIVGLGPPRSQRSYAYPEIHRLLDLTAIVESALSRAHYLMKAQHAEQLATVGLLGASIAHEIRNPLVSIKTFVQLLPKHHQDAAFRDKFFRLIGDEVGRIDRLTEQLLDLAAPRVFASREIGINLLVTSCLDLIAAKAEDKGVGLISTLNANPDVVYTDPNAVKQVVLNLGFNAIQALEQKAADRWIRFETRQVPHGIELKVEDSGPGIAPEVWNRLFQPFQSTKSSGFGLGLAICKDILSSLHASITADPPVTGCGATFRIVLPCQPPSS